MSSEMVETRQRRISEEASASWNIHGHEWPFRDATGIRENLFSLGSTTGWKSLVNTVEMRPSMVNWALGIEGKRWENRLANMTAKFKITPSAKSSWFIVALLERGLLVPDTAKKTWRSLQRGARVDLDDENLVGLTERQPSAPLRPINRSIIVPSLSLEIDAGTRRRRSHTAPTMICTFNVQQSLQPEQPAFTMDLGLGRSSQLRARTALKPNSLRRANPGGPGDPGHE
ncbi:hypothetical protein B0H14DRAFT_2561553 [Mycena olivaceomarginata]|nr:hypothetical protein B0H14DRAFT_2561553 [Mycena olivaceomarginata]